MWVEQRVGPFTKGEVIKFPLLSSRDSNNGLKYVRIGIQAPQSPYVTETRPVKYTENSQTTLGITTYKKADGTAVTEYEPDGRRKKNRWTDPITAPHIFPHLQDPTRTTNSYDIDNTHCFINGVDIEDESYVEYMHSFEIGTGNSGPAFYINAGEVLEFNDMSRIEYFKVKPLQDEDAYTIIEIQYIDE